MAKQGKKYRAALEKIQEGRKYSLDEGLAKVREISEVTARKFDETVELTMWLGVDPRKADQLVRGTVVLPHGVGKTVRVLVIAQGEKVREAEEAGADIVGGEDAVTRIKGGWLDAVVKAKPSTAKGKYVKKVNLASTMSPGVLLDEAVYAR